MAILQKLDAFLREVVLAKKASPTGVTDSPDHPIPNPEFLPINGPPWFRSQFFHCAEDLVTEHTRTRRMPPASKRMQIAAAKCAQAIADQQFSRLEYRLRGFDERQRLAGAMKVDGGDGHVSLARGFRLRLIS
jgi:hypothetical protein